MNRFKSIGLGLAICLAACSARAATITFPLTNSLGSADTNAFQVIPITTPINADGSFLRTGVPIRIVPPSNGTPASTNLAAGNYLATNQFLVNTFASSVGTSRGVIFAVPSSSGTYPFTSNVISGANTYNYNGAQFVATFANIISALGYTPFTPSETTNAIRGISNTNTIAAGSRITLSTNSGIITITSTATGSSNTVSAANSLLTIATNAPNFAISVLSQTNDVVHTNEGRNLHLGVVSVSALTNTGPGLFTSDITVQGTVTSSGIDSSGTIQTSDFFEGNAQNLTNLNASELRSGTVPIARLSGITSNQFDSVTYQTATNRNGGIAVNVSAGFVTGGWGLTNIPISAITNAWAITNVNYNAITNQPSIPTTNNFASISYVQAVSNNAVARYTTNPIVAGSDITLSTNSSSPWGITITASASGSGTGIQTNNGGGSGNTLTNLSTYSTVSGNGGTYTNIAIGAITNILTATISTFTNNNLSITTSTRTNDGGSITIAPANATSSGTGGGVAITAGTAATGSAGTLALSGGAANSSGTPGNVTIFPGVTDASGKAGVVYIGRNVGGPSKTTTNILTGDSYFSNDVYAVNGFFSGSMAMTNLRSSGLLLLQASTNLLGIRGAGDTGANGTYVYTGSQYTNRLTRYTITNNAGSWIIQNASLSGALYSSATLVNSAWTLGSGASPGPASQFGLTNNLEGVLITGPIDSTNLVYQITNTATLKATNAPFDDAVLVATGLMTKWTTNTDVAAATQDEVNTGTIHNKFVAPDTLTALPTATGAYSNAFFAVNTVPEWQSRFSRLPWRFQTTSQFSVTTNVIQFHKSIGMKGWNTFFGFEQYFTNRVSGHLQWNTNKFGVDYPTYLSILHTNGWLQGIWYDHVNATTEGVVSYDQMVQDFYDILTNFTPDIVWIDEAANNARTWALMAATNSKPPLIMLASASGNAANVGMDESLIGLCNAFRIHGDTDISSWNSFLEYCDIINTNAYRYVGPGHFLYVGPEAGGIGTSTETATGVALQAMWSAVFGLGFCNNSVQTYGPYETITNRNILDLQWDPAVVCARIVNYTNGCHWWMKPLGGPNGPTFALCIVNTNAFTTNATSTFDNLNRGGNPFGFFLDDTNGYAVINLKNDTWVGDNKTSITASSIASHDYALYRLMPHYRFDSIAQNNTPVDGTSIAFGPGTNIFVVTTTNVQVGHDPTSGGRRAKFVVKTPNDPATFYPAYMAGSADSADYVWGRYGADGYFYLNGNQNSAATAFILQQNRSASTDMGTTYFKVLGTGEASLVHLIGLSSAPTIVTNAGAGLTGALVTLSANSTDLSGKITLTSGTTPAVSSAIFTLTFNTAYSAVPNVVYFPGNPAAALLSGATGLHSTNTTTTAILRSGPTAITGSIDYIWYYHVQQ